MSIDEIIKSRRIELGLSVDDIAKAIKKDRATVYRYESAYISKMPVSVIKPLAKALQCSPAYIMGWTDNPNETYKPAPEIKTELKQDEKTLITNYRELNLLGKDRVQEYTKDLTGNKKYTSSDEEHSNE